jgi:cytochrome c oxidase subunit 2
MISKWIEEQKKPAHVSDAVNEGRRIFETTACINCHAVSGTVANGRFGPDLTHLMSRDTIASGAAANTTENLRLWIQDPDAIKPSSLMPAMKLSDRDPGALTAYLETLR